MNREYERVSERLLRTSQNRRWHTFWRLKSQRVVSPEYYWRTKSAIRARGKE